MALAELRQQIASVAAQMIDGQIGLLEGCRAVVWWRVRMPEPDRDDPDLLCLVAVESELEDAPLGSVRERWAPDALAEKDKEAAVYLGEARDEILKSCRALVAAWGGPG